MKLSKNSCNRSLCRHAFGGIDQIGAPRVRAGRRVRRLPRRILESDMSISPNQNPEPDPDATAIRAPLNVQGCWVGNVHDRAEGTGKFKLFFAQNGTQLEPGLGGFRVSWNAQNFAQGPIISGTVSSKGIIFKGTATANCAINASGTGTARKIHVRIRSKKRARKLLKAVLLRSSRCRELADSSLVALVVRAGTRETISTRQSGFSKGS